MSRLRAPWLALLVLVAACTETVTSGGQCAFTADCAAGLVCAANFCQTPCGNGGVCPGGMRCLQVPGAATSVCAPAMGDPRCVYASDCPAGLVCNRAGTCQPQCRNDYDCRVLNPFATCVAGACALACTGGAADCDGLARTGCETDTRSAVDHCGACGNACRAGANQAARCESGGCVARCNPGFADCDGDAANGCEADLSAPATCGSCTNRCASPTSLCAVRGATRACVSRCAAPTPVECGGSCVDLMSDGAHCGRCQNPCTAGANGVARCAAGACVAGCNPGFGDCDGDAANGCEVELAGSVAHCGACGRACTPANATPRCAAGQCGSSACNPGFGDCDGNAANGCEAAFATTAAHCGACGVSCATRSAQTGVAHTCVAGQCAPRNDTCAGAEVLDFTVGSALRVSASTRFARADRTASCAPGSGADVWFRFTLTQPELVYADSLGATWDTVLYFANGCTTEVPAAADAQQVLCNDDVARRCEFGGTASQVFAVLPPGTYFLVLAGAAGEVGEATLNVQHLPLGNSPVEYYPVGLSKGSNILTAPLSGAGLIRGTCGGDGPERSYWWAQCPGDPGGNFVADTCNPENGSLDTVLYLRSGDGAFNLCNDNSLRCPNAPRGAYLESMLPGGPGIRVLTVDTIGSGGTGGLAIVRTSYPGQFVP